MTVAEIKEYIDNSIQKSEQVGMSGYDSALYLKNNMRTVKSMLDELEPKAKWVKTQVGYYDDDYGYECSNCKEIYCTEYDFEEMAYNYCPNCGARMNDEVEENNK